MPMEESCDRQMIYQIIFNFYFLTTHLYEINMIKITEKSFKSRSKRNFLNLRVSSRILVVSPFEHPAEEAGVEPILDLGMFHTR